MFQDPGGCVLDWRRLDYVGCMEAAWTLDRGPIPGTRPELLKLKGPRKNPGPILRGRL